MSSILNIFNIFNTRHKNAQSINTSFWHPPACLYYPQALLVWRRVAGLSLLSSSFQGQPRESCFLNEWTRIWSISSLVEREGGKRSYILVTRNHSNCNDKYMCHSILTTQNEMWGPTSTKSHMNGRSTRCLDTSTAWRKYNAQTRIHPINRTTKKW